MTLVEAARKMMKGLNKGLDRFNTDNWMAVKILAKDKRHPDEIKRVVINERKDSKVGAVFGRKGPMKIDDVVCPNCGMRHGDCK